MESPSNKDLWERLRLDREHHESSTIGWGSPWNHKRTKWAIIKSLPMGGQTISDRTGVSMTSLSITFYQCVNPGITYIVWSLFENKGYLGKKIYMVAPPPRPTLFLYTFWYIVIFFIYFYVVCFLLFIYFHIFLYNFIW